MGLLDDVVKGVGEVTKQVGEGINKIQNKTQEAVQSIGLENQVRALEAKKSVALTNLGKLVYDKYEKGDEVGEDVLKRKVGEIVEIEREIELAKAELTNIKQTNDPDVSQSQKAENRAGYSRTPGFTCPHCQAPANQEKLFCAFCGGELKSSKKSDTPPSDNGDNSTTDSSGSAS